MEGELKVLGAAEHNLRDVDVTFGPGLTAVVGVSGSGKSSLVFDVVYNEARRRFIESLALGRVWARAPAAHVRHIDGLGPAVAVAQNVLNQNPASTLATSVGLHPFFRILYARFAEVACPRCAVPVRAVSREERLAIALEMLTSADTLDVEVAVVRGQPGSHARLLAGLRGAFDAVTIDGRPWGAPKSSRVPKLDPSKPHDVVVRVATLQAGMSAAEVRATLERAAATRADLSQVLRVGSAARAVGVSWCVGHVVAPNRWRNPHRAAGPLGERGPRIRRATAGGPSS